VSGFRAGGGLPDRNRHVTQPDETGRRVTTQRRRAQRPAPAASRPWRDEGAGVSSRHRKRQHVRHAVDTTIAPIEGSHAIIGQAAPRSRFPRARAGPPRHQARQSNRGSRPPRHFDDDNPKGLVFSPVS